MKRAAKPENNLVTSLTEVQDVLQQVTAQAEEPQQDDYEEDAQETETKAPTGGKGQPKLTAKKRNRVL